MPLYLEFSEEDLIMIPAESFIEDEDGDDENEFPESVPPFNGLDAEDTLREQYVAFVPLAAYRNPMQGCKEVEVDFDTKDLDRIHLVIVRYSETDDKTEYSGKWHVEKVCTTRREAKEYEKELHESNEDHIRKPWAQDGCEIEEVEIASVPLED